MKNWLTKKNIAVFALALVLVGWGANKLEYVDHITAHAIIDPALAVLVVLFVLCFVRDEIFRSWLNFTAWWIPLGTLLWVLDSWGSGGWVDIRMIPRLLTTSTLVLMTIFLILIKSWELTQVDKGIAIAWWIKWTALIIAFITSIVAIYAYGLIW